jgi:hypothetical protein
MFVSSEGYVLMAFEVSGTFRGDSSLQAMLDGVVGRYTRKQRSQAPTFFSWRN